MKMKLALWLFVMATQPILIILAFVRGVCLRPNLPEAVYNGNHIQSAPGTILTLKCREKYEKGSPTIRCADGKWSRPDPPCKEVMCRFPGIPHHGTILMPCRNYNCTSTYSCDEGYIYRGDTVIVCQRNKTWTNTKGKCEAVHCPQLDDPANGQVHQPSSSYLANATYECDKGFIHTNPTANQRHCLGNNTWSGTTPNCEAVRCPELPGILNGKVLQPNKSFLSTATILCDDGFIYNKPDVIKRQCQGNNTWDGEAGLCEARPCPKITTVEHGILSASEGSFQDSITLQCYSGHILDGPGSVKCQEDGTWSASIGQCQRIRIVLILGIMIPLAVTAIVGIIICWKKCTQAGTIPISKGSDEVELLEADVTSVIKEHVLKVQHKIDTTYDRRINLREQYVRLKLISTKEIYRVQRDNLEVPDRYQAAIEKIVGADIDEDHLVEDGECGKHVLLRGRAGIGKSTLIQMLFWKWANGDWAFHFTGIFFFNLRYLMVIETQVDLATLLSLHTYYTTGENVTRIHREWVEENETNIAIVLDGLDEIGQFENQWHKDRGTVTLTTPLDWCYRLLKRECLKEATLITSSRPFPDLYLIKPNMIVELIGLTRKGVFDFIQKNVDECQRKRVKKTLLKNPILMSVSAITFFCAELCQMLEESDHLPEHLSTYTQITAFILKRYMTRSVKSTSAEDAKMPMLHSLSTLACNGLITGDYKSLPRLIFSEDDFRNANLGMEEMTDLRKAGLLLQTEIRDSSHPRGRQVFGQFVHLSIQEFLAMGGLLSQSLQQIKEKLPILSVYGQFHMALLFLYGLTFNRDATSKLWGLEDQETATDIKELLAQTLKDVKDDLQVLQLVYESQSSDLAHQAGEARFSQGIRFQGTKLTVVEVMAVTFMLQHTPSAHTLQLKNVALDLSSMKELGHFLKDNHTLKHIEIIDGDVDDSWLKELMKGVQHNKTLQTLQLSCVGITDEGVDHIATALFDNSTLEELWLNGLQIGEKGAEAILAALDVNDQIHIRILSCSPAEKARMERQNRITWEH